MLNKLRKHGIVGSARIAATKVRQATTKLIFRDPLPLPPLLRKLAVRPKFSIVQVGAYKGDSENDPLAKFIKKTFPKHPGARALLIEPVKPYFNILKDCYRGVPNVTFENVAVAETAGPREFYRLNADPEARGFPEWLSQLGSLRSDRMGALWDRYEKNPVWKEFVLKNTVTETVQCERLTTLLIKHKLKSIDMLQIDAEGYDFEILKTIDFDIIRPDYINYERILLQDDEPACRALMQTAGYRLFDHGQDTLCTRVN